MKRLVTRRALLSGAAGLSATMLMPRRATASWRPTEPVRILVPAPPGGLTDVMGRLLAQHLQTEWGQSVVVENNGGAGGVIGVTQFVRARPDGHAILIGNPGPNAVAYNIYRNLAYKPEQLLPTSSLIRVPNIISVHPSVPVKSIGELIAYLRANPDKLSYATSGVGQTPHLTAAWFLQLTGLKMAHIPFRGAAPALTAVVGGQVEVLFDNLFPSMPQIDDGKLRPLAVTSTGRVALAPDVPTMMESAPELANFQVTSWFGAFLPAGTSQPAVAALDGEVRKLLTQDGFKKRMSEIGATPTPQGPGEFAAFVQAETEKFGGIIKKEGLQTDVAQ